MALVLDRRGGGFLTMTQAAELAGVHRNTIRAWCASGRLESVRINRRGERRIGHAAVARLIADRAERAERPEPVGQAERVAKAQRIGRAARRPAIPAARARQVPRGLVAGEAAPIVEAAPTDEAIAADARPDMRPGTHTDALRRIAAEVSGARDLSAQFEELLDESFALFNVERAGLWMYDGSAHPFKLATQRGLPAAMLDTISRLGLSDDAAGIRALRGRAVLVHDTRTESTHPALEAAYRALGIASVAFIPIVFQDEPLGLLVLYHDIPYDWSTDEKEMARSFADGLAIALGNARLAASATRLAKRLHAIQELAIRLNRIQDVRGIGEAIVAEADGLLEFDTIRVYRVDQVTQICEPLAFQGRFMGRDRPTQDMLRVPVGTGLTGWVAAHNEVLRTRDAARDPRGLIVGDTSSPESMLIVPMSFEDRVQGVIVVSKLGLDQFDQEDEATLSIFAGYASQAVVNAMTLDQVRRQSAELEHRLVSQRRLLEVNEQLLSTLDPQGILEMIAQSLKTVVAYDGLTIYQVDRAAGVRRAVVARDRYSEVILEYEAPLAVGLTGWSIEHNEAVRANDAHLDPRSIQIPGTPEEPESMLVVPLQVLGEVIGTLNLARMGGDESHFTEDEFELTKLFAGQASIALQNAQAHGEVRVRADHDSLTGLRNHGAFQRELGEAFVAAAGKGRSFAVLMMDLDGFKVFNDTQGHPAGDALLAEIAQAMSGAVRDGDHVYRYGGDEFAVILPGAGAAQGREAGDRIRRAVAAISGPAGAPRVAVSVGVACYPEDGDTKAQLVRTADEALYMVKPSSHGNDHELAARDGYLHALDETAIALMQRLDPTTLLETITARAAHLLGTPHGYIYLYDENARQLVCHVGTGMFVDYLGYRLSPGSGVGGTVYRTGQPIAVDDYDAFAGRAPTMPKGVFGSVLGVPLTSDQKVVGVIGVASGDLARRFGQRETDALSRFAQLASIALDNARLAEAAHRGALYDPATGLPNRELLTDRIGHALSAADPDRPALIAVLLLALDRFNVVKESLGHAMGDRLLVAVAQRLAATLRPGDTLARFGGEEFGIILDPIVDEAEAQRVAERLAAELRTPFDLNGREWFITASMGIAVGRPGGTTPADLLQEAEIALVRAKGDQILRHALFDPSMSAATRERVDLENDLRGALERDELLLHYQPMVDLATDEIVGVEALVRWQHPVRGLLTPLSFVPLAEETGLILPLGRWVLETACRQATEWLRDFSAPNLRLSVNLSAREFAQPDLAARVAAILVETGLPAGTLEIEITESIVMDQSEAGARTLRALRELGVTLALDDFGTGYSSLSYLRHLPIDTLKIDRSFVTGLGIDAANEPIVNAVISLAHGLRMEVVAEGIETPAEAARLLELGCDRGQGYRWARPLTAAEMGQLLRQRLPGPG